MTETLHPRSWITQMDALAFMNDLPAESVDLIITDPPYESLEKHRARGTTTRLKHSRASSNDWFDIFPNARFPDLFTAMYRVLRPDAHLYLFCDAETMFVVKPIAEAAGFRFWKPIVWDKVTIGMGYHYRARCEFILFFEKGKRRLADLSVPDVLRYPRVRTRRRLTDPLLDVLRYPRVRNGYPTEKPVPLIETLVRQSSSPGNLVFDPFFGSCATGVASVQNRRHFLGCDTSPRALCTAHTRLRAAGSIVAGDV
jgi:site-specific DNA-methyltransferase (adenine-specific)